MGATGRDESYGYGKPDAVALLSPHSFKLTALKMPDPDGCPKCVQTESSARVWVYDITSSTYLLNGVAVGSNGQVVFVIPGHSVKFWFDRYYFDGSDYVYLDHINGVSAPSPVFPQAGCPSTFVFAATSASDQAVYIPSFTGDPYAGASC